MAKKQTKTNKKNTSNKKSQNDTKKKQKKHPLITDNLEFTLTIPKKDIKEAYTKVVQKFQPHVSVKGFRKGKAPLKAVEEKVGKQKIYDEVLYQVVPPAYVEEIKKRKLAPIVDPEIQKIDTKENEDWTFKVLVAEKPELDIKNYKKIVKKAKPAKIPKSQTKKNDKKKKTKEQEKQEKRNLTIQGIFTNLVQQLKPQVPELVLYRETHRMVQDFVNRLEKMNITLDSYAKSIGKTSEEIQQQYAAQAFSTLQLEFVLNAIAKEEKIQPSKKELEDITKKSNQKWEKMNRNQQIYIVSMITKQKVIDHLLEVYEE